MSIDGWRERRADRATWEKPVNCHLGGAKISRNNEVDGQDAHADGDFPAVFRGGFRCEVRQP